MFRLARITAIAAFVLCASPAFATIYTLQCPAWSAPLSTYQGDMQIAAAENFHNDAGIPPASKPVNAGSCVPATNHLTQYTCQGALQAPSYGSWTTQTGVSGSGWPVLGNNIVKQPVGGIEQCTFTAFDAWDPLKNRGEPCENGKGNPIHCGVSNKFQREVDILPAGEGGLEFVRYYNSILPYISNRLGLQWSHTYSRYLHFVGSAEISAWRADGKRLLFTLSNSVWSSDFDVPDQLVPVGGNWELTTADDEVETYDSGGKLLSIRTRSGRVTTLTYSDGTGSGSSGSMLDGTTNRPLAMGILLG